MHISSFAHLRSCVHHNYNLHILWYMFMLPCMSYVMQLIYGIMPPVMPMAPQYLASLLASCVKCHVPVSSG
jgi:hypothetical protein